MNKRTAADWCVLRVDLSRGTSSISKQNAKFLGGRGENHAVLLDTTPILPLSAGEAPLVWASGPLAGTGFPGASRMQMAARSPLTGGIGSSSAGSDFALKMRLAGFDQLIIVGMAASPVYLVLESGQAWIRNAKEIAGCSVSETDRWLRSREGSMISTAIIGPAGEKECAAACIMFDMGRAAGRCALGAVMGSKNLKAVVVKGKGEIAVTDPVQFDETVARVLKKIEASDVLQAIHRLGTMQVSPANVEPRCNFQAGVVSPEMNEQLNHHAFAPYYVESYGCQGCPVRCGRRYRVSKGQLAGMESTGLHANSVTDFGTRLGIGDPEAIIAAHGLCNDYGLDIDNTSGVIAWAMEAFQRGALNLKDTDGLTLSWGNTDAVLALLPQIAQRRGIGALLASGCVHAAAELGHGSEEFCITVKGQELEEALRPYKGWALGVVVTERGGTHTRGAPVLELGGEIPAEIAGRAGLPQISLEASTCEGKPEVVVYYERLHAVLDSLGVCYFISDWMDPGLPTLEDYSEALSATCGYDTRAEELLLIGERIHTLGRLLNVAYAGFSRANDYPPSRLMSSPIETGDVLSKCEWDRLLDHYYDLHEWNPVTGWPTHQRLVELGLDGYKWALNHKLEGLG
ncbi:hypothetical protein KAX17_16105 [Candidatus Bipolaricaulota bacterium]|nr:hypothetical protein [Candidatus Bipolaricaulota bacterium]